MNREETVAWVQSLRPGDKVIKMGWDKRPEEILFVNKVTASGIVRTNRESYKVSSYSDRCNEYGGFGKYIIPYSEDVARIAIKNMEEEKERRRIEALIRRAKSVCYDLCNGKTHMTGEMAEAILELVKEEPT